MPSDVAPTAKERLAWLAIKDNAALAQSFVEGMTIEEFATDRRTFYAVTRCLEIISEAARRLAPLNRIGFPRSNGGRSRIQAMCFDMSTST